MNRYLLYSTTKITWHGIVGSFAALKGLMDDVFEISTEQDIKNWFLRN